MKQAVRTLEEIDALHKLGDDTPLLEDEAADFLRCGREALQRYRMGGGGPDYIKPPSATGKPGRNTQVTYLVGDLRAWRQARKQSGTFQANATPRVLKFDTLDDTRLGMPWVADASGRIVGHALTMEALPEEFSLLWQSLEDAVVNSRWGALTAHAEWTAEFSETFERVIHEASLEQGAEDLESATVGLPSANKSRGGL